MKKLLSAMVSMTLLMIGGSLLLINISGQAAATNQAPARTVSVDTNEIVIFDSGNGAGVASNPTQPTTFTINQSMVISYIQDYHYFNNGALPGTISLKHADGTVYGPWQTRGLPGQGGVQNAFWVVEPLVTIKAGSYTVLDSDPATWSQNSGSGNAGFTVVIGYPAALPQRPQLSVSLLAGRQALVSWPASLTGFVLESTDNLKIAQWQQVTTTPVTVVDRSYVTNNAASGAIYFRLRK